MTFNTSLCFFLIGLFYFLPKTNVTSNYKLELILGYFLISVGAIVCIESLFNTPITIDQIFVKVIPHDDLKNPGRMSTLTAIGFITSGLVMVLLRTAKTTVMFYVIHLLILTMLLMGMFGIIQNEIFDLISSKYAFNRMAFASTFLFVLLSTILWPNWYRLVKQHGFTFDDYNISNLVKSSIIYFGLVVTVLILYVTF